MSADRNRLSPWARLPRAVRYLVLGTAAVVLLWVLFTVVFPWVEVLFEDPTLGGLNGPGGI